MSYNHQIQDQLFANIKSNIVALEELSKKANDHWNYEDLIYRFYHHSYKVYYIQDITMQIVDALKKLSPNSEINDMFEDIFEEGTGKVFNIKHNKSWEKHTRPQLEAFFHAKYFLEMAVKYGKELDKIPDCLPSGLAGLLCFYNLR